jgi:cysteine desulfurase
VNVKEWQADFVSFTSHKMYGPKGVGALFVKSEGITQLKPILYGGGHEQGLRSGTLNVPGIVGLGEACAIAQKKLKSEYQSIKKLRDALKEKIFKAIPKAILNGHPTERLPQNLSITFPGVSNGELMLRLTDIALSTGSACSSDKPETSHVLKACGLSDKACSETIRLGLHRFTTQAEIDFVAKKVIEQVKKLQKG